MDAAITTSGLTRRFPGGVGLDDVTLDAHPGEVLALLGPNGAGKTTTVRLLNGVLTPDAGSARVLGIDPAIDGDAVRRRTGVLTENAGLDDRLTARENLAVVARIRGLRGPAADRRITDLIDRFGMGDRADVAVQGASTGQRKRLALARALLHDPEVLFLDEPTSGLDPAATRDVVELIASLAGEHGRAVILCTHFLGEAGQLADRMAVLHRGRLRAAGRPAEIAATIWEGLPVELELPAAADDRLVGWILARADVLAATATPTGARVTVRDRDTVPGLVAALVGAEIAVYAATPSPPSLEDVYFAVEARIAAEDRAAEDRAAEDGVRR
ncbi:MAG TPA: ABC transporter ATP-binding protein [Acidimicrobiales bacterium]|nr:ABC transporter ATP-binding protein [Acidimicrobiales bacterium]